MGGGGRGGEEGEGKGGAEERRERGVEQKVKGQQPSSGWYARATVLTLDTF